MAKSIDEYIDYIQQISAQLNAPDSTFSLLQANIQELFEEYGFDNVTKSEILAQVNASAINIWISFQQQVRLN